MNERHFVYFYDDVCMSTPQMCCSLFCSMSFIAIRMKLNVYCLYLCSLVIYIVMPSLNPFYDQLHMLPQFDMAAWLSPLLSALSLCLSLPLYVQVASANKKQRSLQSAI